MIVCRMGLSHWLKHCPCRFVTHESVVWALFDDRWNLRVLRWDNEHESDCVCTKLLWLLSVRQSPLLWNGGWAYVAIVCTRIGGMSSYISLLQCNGRGKRMQEGGQIFVVKTVDTIPVAVKNSWLRRVELLPFMSVARWRNWSGVCGATAAAGERDRHVGKLAENLWSVLKGERKDAHGNPRLQLNRWWW